MLKLTAKRKEWFQIEEDSSGEAALEIQYLKPGEMAEINELANPVTGRSAGDENFVTEVKPNPRLRREKILDRVIKKWKGFNDTEGNPLACTLKNKILVCKEYDWFFDRVEEFHEILSGKVRKEEEEAEGN